jgi:hypothetical protein
VCIVKLSAPFKGEITLCMSFGLFKFVGLFDLCVGRADQVAELQG